MSSFTLRFPSIYSSPKISPRSTTTKTKSSFLNFNQNLTTPNSISLKNVNSSQFLSLTLLKPNNNIPIIKSTTPSHICMASYQTVPASDRLISIIAYFIPFLSGLSYGYHLFSYFPTLEFIFNPFVPILAFYKSIPGSNLLTFFGLYLGVVRDRKFNRFVRFNALQALLLEFLMIVPSLLHVVFPYGEGFGFKIIQVVHSVCFVVVLCCFVYALGFCIFGKKPYFPKINEVIEWRLFAEDQF